MNCLLLLLSLLGAEQVIDEFRYADPRAAAATWVAKSATPPVEMIADGGRNVLKVIAPFATDPELPRAVVDREIQLDLAAPGAFSLEVASDAPEVLPRLTLYFRSGDGWYAGGATLAKKGWQTLRFSKASFRSEGNPAGWHKIEAVRIAAWRSLPRNASLRVRRLAALSHEVAVVVPDRSSKKAESELRSALDTAERVSGMLGELGLGADAIDESGLPDGALGNRLVAVLAYNPGLSDEAAAALQRFVDAGGKLLVCYQLPEGLGRVLGFGGAEYIKQQRPGQFAEIRFDAAGVPGLPEKVRQASWNITIARPLTATAAPGEDGKARHNARVIGRWYDDRGEPTGRAAMLLSDRGAFFSHILLADDREQKKEMLAAILGRLAPPLWRQMAEAALVRSGKAGHCGSFQEAVQWVKTTGDVEVRQRLNLAVKARAKAAKEAGRQLGPEAVELAARSHDLLVDAYLRAQPSPRREGRATWNHSGTGAYPGDWERSARLLAENGFNMVLPNMLWAGRAHYPSDVLPRSATFKEHGDQVAQCVAAARRHGLEVHVWKVNFNLSGAPEDFVEKLRREGRLQVSARGETHKWLCPSHPENQRLELESMLEVGRNYAVDGLHFDYIRYPGSDYCYCDGCRKRFEAATGRKVLDWPADCRSGSRRAQYNDWRCDQIMRLVAAVHREAKKIRSELKISAAVFGAYPACRTSIAQDWPKWIKAGYLDFVCPMNYTQSDLQFASWVRNQLELVDDRIPVYPGVGAWRLSADRAVGQIHHARALGAAGFTIFNFNGQAAESIIPAVGLGVGEQKAAPPHRGR